MPNGFRVTTTQNAFPTGFNLFDCDSDTRARRTSTEDVEWYAIQFHRIPNCHYRDRKWRQWHGAVIIIQYFTIGYNGEVELPPDHYAIEGAATQWGRIGRIKTQTTIWCQKNN